MESYEGNLYSLWLCRYITYIRIYYIFCDSNHYTKDEESVLAKCSVRQRQGNIVMYVVSQSKSVSLNAYKM